MTSKSILQCFCQSSTNVAAKGILLMILEDFKKCSGRIIRVSEHFRSIEAITCSDVSIFRKFCSQLVSHP